MGTVERKGKNLIPTEKAYELVDAVPDKVKSAVLTAEWEQQLEQIYKGKATGDDFIKGIENFVKEIISSYTEKCVFYENGREIIVRCPRCCKNVYENQKRSARRALPFAINNPAFANSSLLLRRGFRP